MKTDSVYYVYWDCDSQCELWRGTLEEANAMDFDVFGGGSYMVYPCVTGHRIMRVTNRVKSGDGQLHILTRTEE